MRPRLRRIRALAGLSLAWLLDTIELGDVLTVIGLILLGVGLWHVSHAAGLAVPGAVLLFYALPSRPPFIQQRGARLRKDGS